LHRAASSGIIGRIATFAARAICHFDALRAIAGALLERWRLVPFHIDGVRTRARAWQINGPLEMLVGNLQVMFAGYILAIADPSTNDMGGE